MSFARNRFAKTSPVLVLAAVFALVLILGGSFSAFSQETATPATDYNSQLYPPPSIGADIPLTYFGR